MSSSDELVNFYPIEIAPKDGSLLVCMGVHNTDNLGVWKIGQPWVSVLKYNENLGWVTQENDPCWSEPKHFFLFRNILVLNTIKPS